MKKIKSITLSSLLIFLLVGSTIYSFAMSSTNYSILWDVVDGGGGNRNSTNYIINDSAAQSDIGTASSSNYQVEIGYWAACENNPPNIPGSPSPGDGATGQDINVDLSWTGGDADGDTVVYDVYFEANDSTPDILVSDDQLGTTYDPGALNYDTHYYWKIIAKDSHGATTSGPVWDFTTGSAPNNPPNIPGQPSGPTSGVTGISFSYSTSATDPDGDQVKYVFDWDDGNMSETGYVDSGTVASKSHIWAISGTYFVKAKAVDIHGASSTSWSTSLTVNISVPNNPPNIPGSPSPGDGATGQDINVDLSWTGGDADGDTVVYDVYFEANDSTPDILVSDDQLGTTYDPGALNYDTHYYWKIIAKDSHGATTSGLVWDFTTTNRLPNVPTLVSPLDDYVTTSGSIITFKATFSDPDMANTGKVNFQISKYTDFHEVFQNGNSAIVANGEEGEWTFGVLSVGTYFWRAQNEDEHGATSNWSNYRTLTIGATYIKIEDKADGTGSEVDEKTVSSGSSFTVYAISRDADDNFVANIPVTWSLIDKTEGIADADLVPAGYNKRATFTGHKIGTAKIKIYHTTLGEDVTGTITVVVGVAGDTNIKIEDKADGTGNEVDAKTISSGNSFTVYAINRDAYDNFIANVPVTWVLIDKTEGIADADLIPAGDSKSATFTGHKVGSAKITAEHDSFGNDATGTITVIVGSATHIEIEDRADGTGNQVNTKTISSGNSFTVYAVSRDANDNFVANVSVTWSLTDKTKGIVDSDLVSAGDNKSATFTGAGIGSAKIKARHDTLGEAKTMNITVTPSKTVLYPNYPNPFRPGEDKTTTIQYDLGEDVRSIEIEIYTLAGDLVRSWPGNPQEGRHKILWNGTNEGGRAIASGMYIVVIKRNGKVRDRKRMVIIK